MYFVGDEHGRLKALRINSSGSPSELVELVNSESPKSSVSAISVHAGSVAVAHANGAAAVYTWNDEELQSLYAWKETRLQPQDNYVGFQYTDRGVYSCTSNGALRLVPIDAENKNPLLGSLPTRLCVWRLDSSSKTFAYGGNEVDVSLWNLERAFSHDDVQNTSISKRKRDALFPGEIWRAKNVQTDNLGLRQPVRVTALTYVPTSSTPQLLAGTQFGDLRLYDTRARRPASEWKNIAKTGGVKVLERGLTAHEVFMGDHGCNLSSVDLRNGRIAVSYKGLSGAVTSVAPSSTPAPDGRGGQTLVSTALDRYCRIHSSFPPPSVAGQNQENQNKGQVIEKVFTTGVPTVVVWDGVDSLPHPTLQSNVEEGDDMWDEMENIVSDDESDRRKRRRKQDK
ncbi:hypothetical protein C8F01DRAFT_1055485 [Mycena amicta]|nr:hypothetical protein C8F01DRAFT_1055485 [Mycena amicta]